MPKGYEISAKMQRRNVHNANDIGAGLGAWYFSQPPISRTFITVILLTTVLSFTFEKLDLFKIALIWPRVWQKFEVGLSMYAVFRS